MSSPYEDPQSSVKHSGPQSQFLCTLLTWEVEVGSQVQELLSGRRSSACMLTPTETH